MDFSVKRLATDASIFLSRAVQFTEEKLGQADRTELDVHLENLLIKSELTKQWTEKIMKQIEVLLQPNPNVRMQGFLYEMLDMEAPRHLNTHEQLGECMISSGHEFGPGTDYGKALIKCGETERQIGEAERRFVDSSTVSLLTPFRTFLDWEYKTISREGRLMQNKRLDLDAAKSRLKKAKLANARSVQLNCTPPLGEDYRTHFSYMLSFLHLKWLKIWATEVEQAETELRLAQDEFDRQAEIMRLLLEGIGSTHMHQLCCLKDFVEAQTAYYAQCCKHMVDLRKKLGSSPFSFASNQPSTPTVTDASDATLLTPVPTLPPGTPPSLPPDL